MNRLLVIVSLILLALSQWFTWSYAPVEQIMGPVQKIFYVHMPLAALSLISFFVVFVASILYIAKRNAKFDQLAGAAAEIGVLFSGIALITGSLWARASWNVWWTWDPRLTTTLIMWFVYAAYLLLRAGGANGPAGDKRRLVSAALGIVAFIDVPLVFLSARLFRSIHPAVLASKGGGMEPEMLHTLLVCLAAWTVVWVLLLRVRYAQITRSERIEAMMTYDEL